MFTLWNYSEHQGYAFLKSHQVLERCHFKEAMKYLKDVTLKKQFVLFWHYNSGDGRYAQAKQWSWTQVQQPRKRAEFWLHMLKNAE